MPPRPEPRPSRQDQNTRVQLAWEQGINPYEPVYQDDQDEEMPDEFSLESEVFGDDGFSMSRPINNFTIRR